MVLVQSGGVSDTVTYLDNLVITLVRALFSSLNFVFSALILSMCWNQKTGNMYKSFPISESESYVTL